MSETPTEQEPYVVCTACQRRHDPASWRTLPVRGGGVGGTSADGKEVATYITEIRLCPCGHLVTIQFPMPTGTTPSHATAVLALSLMDKT